MSSSISDFISIGYKRAVYGTLVVSCITSGILYLYLNDFPSFNSLANTKIIFLGFAIASPLIVFNIAVAFVVVYLAFTKEQYQEGERLKEEVLNRIIFMSSILATSLSLNLSVIGLYFIEFKPDNWHKIAAFIFNIIILIICIFTMKKKVDLDLFHHNFSA